MYRRRLIWPPLPHYLGYQTLQFEGLGVERRFSINHKSKSGPWPRPHLRWCLLLPPAGRRQPLQLSARMEPHPSQARRFQLGSASASLHNIQFGPGPVTAESALEPRPPLGPTQVGAPFSGFSLAHPTPKHLGLRRAAAALGCVMAPSRDSVSPCSEERGPLMTQDCEVARKSQTLVREPERGSPAIAGFGESQSQASLTTPPMVGLLLGLGSLRQDQPAPLPGSIRSHRWASSSVFHLPLLRLLFLPTTLPRAPLSPRVTWSEP